jgi:hypothetical protein
MTKVVRRTMPFPVSKLDGSDENDEKDENAESSSDGVARVLARNFHYHVLEPWPNILLP